MGLDARPTMSPFIIFVRVKVGPLAVGAGFVSSIEDRWVEVAERGGETYTREGTNARTRRELEGRWEGESGRAQRPLSRGSHSLRYPARDSRPLGRPKYPRDAPSRANHRTFWVTSCGRCDLDGLRKQPACARRRRGTRSVKVACFFFGYWKLETVWYALGRGETKTHDWRGFIQVQG